MKQVIVDANVFLRFILKDIPKQYITSQKLFIRAKKNEVKLIVPQIVIFEIVFALDKYYRFTKNELADKIESLIGADYFQIEDREFFKIGLQLYKSYHLSLADCFLVAKSKILDIPLFTFDRVVDKLSKK